METVGDWISVVMIVAVTLLLFFTGVYLRFGRKTSEHIGKLREQVDELFGDWYVN